MKRIADLFCGAGGTSTGILQACAEIGTTADLLAVNHWPTAINTHSLNHPGVRHICEPLDNISPSAAVPSRQLDLLAASPECTHHSTAAGGRPKNDQSRATAWHVCRWAADLTVKNILIENVREFQNWGPLGKKGKPLKRRKGETFKAFINALRSMGFNVEYRVLNAADFGDPTSRQRLLIMARRGKPIIWPDATHGLPVCGSNLLPYRTAREIIDWEMKGKSIFSRKKALSPNTIKRIAAGLKKFGGANAEPFLVILNGTASDQIQYTAKSVDAPVPTQTTCGHIGLAQPFILTMEHRGSEREIDRPLPTITTARGGAMAVVEPFLVKFHGNHRGSEHGTQRVYETGDPLPTIDTSNRFGLVEPILLGQQSGHNGSPVSAPVPTIATSGAIGLVEPFIVKYYGTALANSVNEPLDTVTTKDRFMLVEPKSGRIVAELDILFRMLQPHELAAAMSFPKGYRFTGNRGDQVKQIGNAVAVNFARAHALALLS